MRILRTTAVLVLAACPLASAQPADPDPAPSAPADPDVIPVDPDHIPGEDSPDARASAGPADDDPVIGDATNISSRVDTRVAIAGFELGGRATFQPEIGFVLVQSSDTDDHEAVLTIGLGVTGGN